MNILLTKREKIFFFLSIFIWIYFLSWYIFSEKGKGTTNRLQNIEFVLNSEINTLKIKKSKLMIKYIYMKNLLSYLEIIIPYRIGYYQNQSIIFMEKLL